MKTVGKIAALAVTLALAGVLTASRFACAQRFDRSRRRKVRLAGSCGTRAEENRAFPQRLAVFRLTGGLRANCAPAVDFEGRRVRDFLAANDFVERALNVLGRKGRAVAVDPALEPFEERRGAARVFGVLRPYDQLPLFLVDDNPNAERFANPAQMLVARAEYGLQHASVQDDCR